VTKADAIKKIADLLRVANSTSNPHESETARRIATKLSNEHHVNEKDLKTSSYVAAYDELVKTLTDKLNDKLAFRHSVFGLRQVLDHVTPALSGLGDEEKVNRVLAIVKIVRGVNLLAGTVPAIGEVSTLVESIVRKYEITP
jgi:hypothetical protein